jgi:hypothetical protein
VHLLAIAGGPGFGDEDVLGCCGMFVVLPLVVILAGLAAYRNSVWVACCGMLSAGLPYLLLRQMVASYQPSDDGDVRADQASGHLALVSYAWLVGIAGLGLVAVAIRRLCRWGWRPAEPGAAADGRLGSRS